VRSIESLPASCLCDSASRARAERENNGDRLRYLSISARLKLAALSEADGRRTYLPRRSPKITWPIRTSHRTARSGCKCARMLRACVPPGSGGAWVRQVGHPDYRQTDHADKPVDSRYAQRASAAMRRIRRKRAGMTLHAAGCNEYASTNEQLIL